LKRRYETILLFDIDAGDEKREAFLNRSKALIEQYDGNLLDQDEWGVRKLAYEVRKKNRGYYVRLDYYSKTDMIDEFERIARLEESVMKYLTILLEDAFDMEQYERGQSLPESSDQDDEDSETEHSNSFDDTDIEEVSEKTEEDDTETSSEDHSEASTETNDTTEDKNKED
jgi:small subunit ribosomal protein S6